MTASIPPTSAGPSTAGEECWQQNAVLRSFVRFRWPILAVVVVILLSCYNGRWRIGRDSALYRAVAHNLATGQGYTFRGEHERHIYPGLPLILAGIERTFGAEDPMRPRVALNLMVGMAVLTLVAVYNAVRLYFPTWVAVCVTTGVGVNKKFIQNAHDVMSDIPFLLGVSLALWGIALLHRTTAKSHRFWGVLLMTGGGGIALAMRPTFWALAVAWGIVAAVGLLIGPRRGAHAVMLLSLVALVGVWTVVDPRTPDESALGGTYERKALANLSDVAHLRLGERSVALFEEAIPEAFYGLELGVGIDTVTTIVILACTLFLVRRVPLWALYVVITTVMLFIFGPIPRYFLMILPLLLLGVALMIHRVSLMVPQRNYFPEIVILLGTGSIVAPNLIRDADLFMEQHALTFHGRTDFLKSYDDGNLYPIVTICDAITDESSGFYVQPHQLILTHEPRIMSYLTGRRAYRAAELVPDGDATAAMKRIREMNFEFGTFPAKLYDEEEPTRHLIEQNLITPAPGAPALIVEDVHFTRIAIQP